MPAEDAGALTAMAGALFAIVGVVRAFVLAGDLGVFFATFFLPGDDVFDDGNDFFGFSLAELEDFAGGEWGGVDVDALDHVHDDCQVAGGGDEDELIRPFVGSHAGIPFKVAFERALDEVFNTLLHFGGLHEVELDEFDLFANDLRTVHIFKDSFDAL